MSESKYCRFCFNSRIYKEPEDDWEAFKKEEQLSEQNDDEDDDDDYELTQEDWDRIDYLCSKED